MYPPGGHAGSGAGGRLDKDVAISWEYRDSSNHIATPDSIKDSFGFNFSASTDPGIGWEERPSFPLEIKLAISAFID